MLSILLLTLPLLLAVFIYASKAEVAKKTALLGSFALLAATIASIVVFIQDANNPLLYIQQDWIGPLGMTYNFTLDGISLLMTLLTAICLPLIVYASYNRTFKSAHQYYALMFLMIAGMNGAFITADGLMFYICYEFALLPIYFMILHWSNNEQRARITLKFFLYTLFGSLFMLLSLLYLYSEAQSFALADLYRAGQSMSTSEQGFVFAGFMIAFGVKIPIFPLHTWQPSTYDAAPTSGTMLLGGIMLKMATYGIIRLILPTVPDGVAAYGDIALIFCGISVVYASAVAIAQKRYKLLIAYSSVAHVGLLAAGILSGNAQGIQGGLMEMLSHGILTIGLFFVYDMLEDRYGHDRFHEMGGIRHQVPTFAFLFFVIVMGSVALPGTSGFVGEFMLLLGLFQANPIWTGIAGLTVVLGAVYMLRSFQTMMLGDLNSTTSRFTPMTKHERIVLISVVLLVILLGIYPAPLMQLTQPTIMNLITTIQ
jgi:NADH-quinone oxidoreductase subunit M